MNQKYNPEEWIKKISEDLKSDYQIGLHQVGVFGTDESRKAVRKNNPLTYLRKIKPQDYCKSIMKTGLLNRWEDISYTLSEFGSVEKILNDFERRENFLNYEYETESQNARTGLYDIVVAIPSRVIVNGERYYFGHLSTGQDIGSNYDPKNIDALPEMSMGKRTLKNSNIPKEFIYGYICKHDGVVEFTPNLEHISHKPPKEQEEFFKAIIEKRKLPTMDEEEKAYQGEKGEEKKSTIEEKVEMSPEQKQQIYSMLQSHGLSQSEIDVILNGNYESYNSEYDLDSAFGGLRKHGDILEKLSDGYTMDELQEQGISSQKIDAFNQMLSEKNISVDNAKAIYQYSVGSNMILGVKRGTSKETIQEQIMSDLEESLQARGVKQDDIEKMKQFVKDADYGENPLHNSYDIANRYMEKIGLKQESRVSIRSAMQSMHRCTHIDETIASLEEGLGSMNMPKSMKLYRAVKSSYLEKGLKQGEDLSSLIGKSISNKGQTSTSPLYDSSFASLDEYDSVFEIYTPKGTRGSYIAELSAYDKTEQEVLLNPNDLYITGVQTGVVDKNGKTKNVLQALCLSKDMECYRGIDKEQEKSITSNGQQQYENIMKTQNGETNLPARQGRFSRFFNQIRSVFSKQDFKHNLQNSEKPETQIQKKRFCELKPEEKTKIQRETAEIAKRYREQKDLQGHVSTQDLQQDNFQPMK